MALATTAGSLALAAYLDGKYQIRKDIAAIRKVKKAERAYQQAVKEDRVSPWYILAETCYRQPNDRAIWSRERTLTFGELHDLATKYAQWLLDQGIRPGDLVALYMLNRAEFIILVFACHCIGAAPAFINYNLEGKALMHCLNVCESKILVADTDAGCQTRIEGSRSDIEAKGTKIVTLDDDVKRHIEDGPVEVPEDKWRKGIRGDAPFVLLYTSGTTGLPKGCPYNLNRLHLIGSHVELPFGCKAGVDCWYSSMPLYHGTASIALTSMLLAGVSVAIAPKFSVSGFWPDMHDSGATIFIYVGETARYLLNAPPHPLERKHKLRAAYGNGLRPDVWPRLQQRFNLPEIIEFFNSSEGVFGLAVWDRGPFLQNCVGHQGLLMRLLTRNLWIPVEVDHETGDILRDPHTGFAKRLPYEQGGEILVAVPDRSAFGGYWHNEDATARRFAIDVFKKGDLYYRTGDALRRGSDGHWYFLDRLGDTFRWKSENVATAEVAETLGRVPGVAEANVYGVSVPNHEGRAGCAAIHATEGELDFEQLLGHARKALPRYAVPVFLRVVKVSSHIHNHKQNKVLLRREGVDPDLIGTEDESGKDDAILWLSPTEGRYVPFRRHDWESLKQGKASL